MRESLIVKYIAKQLTNTASNTLISEYCERIDNSVVSTPEPTNNGNTIGIIVASLFAILIVLQPDFGTAGILIILAFLFLFIYKKKYNY